MPISNAGIIKKKKEFTFPELIEADRYMKSPQYRENKSVYLRPGQEQDAFGPDLLKDKKFRRELRRLQEKHKLIGLV